MAHKIDKNSCYFNMHTAACTVTYAEAEVEGIWPGLLCQMVLPFLF